MKKQSRGTGGIPVMMYVIKSVNSITWSLHRIWNMNLDKNHNRKLKHILKHLLANRDFNRFCNITCKTEQRHWRNSCYDLCCKTFLLVHIFYNRIWNSRWNIWNFRSKWILKTYLDSGFNIEYIWMPLKQKKNISKSRMSPKIFPISPTLR